MGARYRCRALKAPFSSRSERPRSVKLRVTEKEEAARKRDRVRARVPRGLEVRRSELLVVLPFASGRTPGAFPDGITMIVIIIVGLDRVAPAGSVN